MIPTFWKRHSGKGKTMKTVKRLWLLQEFGGSDK